MFNAIGLIISKIVYEILAYLKPGELLFTYFNMYIISLFVI